MVLGLPERRWHFGQKQKLRHANAQWHIDLGHIQVCVRSTALNSRQKVGRKSRHAALKIISCTVKTGVRNPYGEVSSAILLVEGVLKEFKLWNDEMVIPDSLVPPSFEVEMKSKDRWLRFPFFCRLRLELRWTLPGQNVGYSLPSHGYHEQLSRPIKSLSHVFCRYFALSPDRGLEGAP